MLVNGAPENKQPKLNYGFAAIRASKECSDRYVSQGCCNSQRILYMIAKNILYRRWNQGPWRSFYNTHQTFLVRVLNAPIIYVIPVA